jgi:hypothetical protein
MDLIAKRSAEPPSLADLPPADSWRLRDLWREGRAPRDRFFDDAAASGELLVARVRLFVVTLLTLILVLPGWDAAVQWVALGTGALSLAWAVGILALVRVYYRSWLAFVSAAMDITMVSAGLLGLMLAGRPDAAVNSRVLFEAYFLALGYSALRYDWRVCAMSGLLAAAQYGLLMAFAQAHWQLEDLGRGPDGVFSWNVQIARVLMLGAASVLSATLVLRGQRLRHASALDRLTGLHNRGAFDERLAQEASRAWRCSTSTTSSASTTPTVTRAATRRCAPWPGCCARPCGARTWWRATGGRSSPWSCPRRRPRAPWSGWRRSARRSPGSCCPTRPAPTFPPASP